MLSLVKSIFLVPAVLLLSGLLQASQPHPAQFIWVDHQTHERQVFAYFRYDFTILKPADEANLHLFADSRYHLFVNGDFVNFGPSRTFPENPRIRFL